MSPYLNSISLIRYLLVWRINSSLVRLPRCPSTELSSVLGAIITKRLPTSEASRWRKAEKAGQPEIQTTGLPAFRLSQPWPIEAVLLVYPGKKTYGQGELILWELKLIGESADHGFFLEVILPAMEEASYTSEPQWNRPNKLWGRFDIHSVYVARGSHWEPLVSDGRLDLRYRVNPVQWAEGLTFGSGLPTSKFGSPTRLIWLTPFDFGEEASGKQVSPLRSILEALIARMSLLMPDNRKAGQPEGQITGLPAFRLSQHCTCGDQSEMVLGTATLSTEEPLSIQDAMAQADNVPILHDDIKRAPRDCPGHYTGTQIFSYIPLPIIPYLELASILHIGRHTHFGCGTFTLIRSTGEVV